MKPIHLVEWGRTRVPGIWLDDPAVARDARALGHRLVVGEDRHGLTLQAKQYVGKIRLGPLQVVVQPKLEARRLWQIVAYALELDRQLQVPVEVDLATDGLPDLLALALLAEARRLRRHLRRAPAERREWLEAPRGRVEVAQLARHSPLTRAALPCRFDQRTSDIVINQAVLAGLECAQEVASAAIRTRLALEAAQWRPLCAAVRASRALFDAADMARNRLSAEYETAHRLARWLYVGRTPDLVGEEEPALLRGFLWNMHAVFEKFVARFLGDHLPGVEVRSQEVFDDLFRVRQPAHGYRRPSPRPDLVLRRGGTVVCVVDTKYTDLSEHHVDRGDLYQVSLYALAQRTAEGAPAPGIILYPDDSRSRSDVVLDIHPPSGRSTAVVIRGIAWSEAADALAMNASRQAQKLAQTWTEIA